jgi:hypothetical protein
MNALAPHAICTSQHNCQHDSSRHRPAIPEWRRIFVSTAFVSVVIACSLWQAPAYAGTTCEGTPITPTKIAAAAATAKTVATALDARAAPVAMVSRMGRDLSKHGLVYSHAGFAVRDHPAGRWSVVHLLNDCSSDGSGLYTQGLVNFFADDLVNQDARITWLQPDMAERLAKRLLALPRDALYTPRYNLIARPGSREYQNSTAWMLEHLAAATTSQYDVHDRSEAYAIASRDGFQADTVHIPYSKRIAGGLFGANLAFTDHSVATRLKGDYPVVTVRSILRWLNASKHIDREQEWRHGRLMTTLGPG